MCYNISHCCIQARSAAEHQRRMTIKNTAKIIIATAIVAVLLALFFIKNMAQDAVESAPAPFGLEWGMTCKEILAVSVGKHPLVGCAVISELPQGLRGYEYLLDFDSTGGLIAVYASNVDFKHPDKEARTLKSSLAAKYGPGSSSDSEKHLRWVWNFADGSAITLFSPKKAPSGVFLVYRTSDAHALKKLKDKL